jgi:hypothetical protein
MKWNGNCAPARESEHKIPQHDANGQKDVPMHRKRSVNIKLGLVPIFVLLAGFWWPVRGDLIRPKTSRTFPDIAGDLVGSQTYTFDPSSKTGTFQVVNAPQFIALGPTGHDMLNVSPDNDGTLSQTLRLKLDMNGRLVENPDNRFQLFGSVVIGDQVYRGLLLEGKPTAFGAQVQSGAPLRNANVFDLNVQITGGQLAQAFGTDAYFRITPQSNSTFQGSFASSFSGDKPLTNLRALQGHLPAAVPEPTPLLILLTGGTGVLISRLWRRTVRRPFRSTEPPSRPGKPVRSGTGPSRPI